MAWYDFLKGIFGGDDKSTPPPEPKPAPTPAPKPAPIPTPRPKPAPPTITAGDVRRHFYNEPGFQTYGSFFHCWGGWITAGHVLSEAGDFVPPFAGDAVRSWPGGLDAALLSCVLPSTRPAPPTVGQSLIVRGYPAGSRFVEDRQASAYYERAPGVWIAHITMPDEPVVTGMSGGAVIDAASGQPLGILITRNSPADLNSDRDPDESCDFVALSAVWDAVQAGGLVA